MALTCIPIANAAPLYVCLAADYPPAATGIKDGARLLVADTGSQYVLLSGTWYSAPMAVASRAVSRQSAAAYRSGLTASDLMAAMSAPSVADVATGGSLVFNTAYKCSVAGGNAYGPGKPSATGTVTTANDSNSTHVVRATIPAQTGATYFDLFLSTDAAPLWVGRITEAQRAAGCTITAMGTVSATTPGAGLVDIRVAGTGLPSTTRPFSTEGAVNLAALPVIITDGFTNVRLGIRFNPTSYANTSNGASVRAKLCSYLWNTAIGDWTGGAVVTQDIDGFAALVNTTIALYQQDVQLSTFGSPKMVVAVYSIALNTLQTGTFDLFSEVY